MGVTLDLTFPQIKGLRFFMVTGGGDERLLSEVGSALKNLGLTAQVSRRGIQTVVSTGIRVITKDLSPKEALAQILVIPSSSRMTLMRRFSQRETTPALQRK